MTNPRAIIAQVAREYIGTRETSANRVIVPIADNIVESGETVVLTV